ncbi:MAG: hypothetical protein IJB48_05475 [Clostridia bacterium]|nr:hypothetical protein [Clostridia bacterium]
MGYADLSLNDYANLTLEGYAQLPLEGGTGSGSTDDSGSDAPITSCAWTATTVSALQNVISTLASKVDTLQTTVSAIKAKTDNLPASPASTSDVKLTTTTQTVDVSGLATSEALANAISITTAIKAKTDNLPANPASKTDVKTTVTTQTVDVTTQTVDVSGLATKAELAKVFALIANWSVTGATLTAKGTDGATLGTFTLTKDVDGNITSVTPA